MSKRPGQYLEESPAFLYINVLIIKQNIVNQCMLLNSMLSAVISRLFLQKNTQLHLTGPKQTIKSICKCYFLPCELPAELSLACGVE